MADCSCLNYSTNPARKASKRFSCREFLTKPNGWTFPIISSSNRHQPVKTTHEPEILILQDDDLDLNLSEDPSLAQHSAMHSISIDITSDDVHEEHENFSSVFRHRSVLPLPPKTPKESVSFGGGEVFQRVGTSGGGQGVGMLPPRTPAAAVVIAGDWRVTCDV